MPNYEPYERRPYCANCERYRNKDCKTVLWFLFGLYVVLFLMVNGNAVMVSTEGHYLMGAALHILPLLSVLPQTACAIWLKYVHKSCEGHKNEEGTRLAGASIEQPIRIDSTDAEEIEAETAFVTEAPEPASQRESPVMESQASGSGEQSKVQKSKN